MSVKASEIKFLFIPKDSIRKKRCGCIETRINMIGGYIWVTDVDGLCKSHKAEQRREYSKQHKVIQQLNPQSKKKKRKAKQ